jgi:hypothetical protein
MKTIFTRALIILLCVVSIGVVKTAYATVSVSTNPATNVTTTSATLKGYVTATEPSKAWFEYKACSTCTPDSSWAYTNDINMTGNGAISLGITGLTPNTTYRYVAWVRPFDDDNGDNVVQATEVQTFTTSSSGTATTTTTTAVDPNSCKILSSSATPNTMTAGGTTTIAWTATTACNTIYLTEALSGRSYTIVGSAVFNGTKQFTMPVAGSYNFKLTAIGVYDSSIANVPVLVTASGTTGTTTGTTTTGQNVVKWNTLGNDLPLVRSKDSTTNPGPGGYGVTTTNVRPNDVVTVILYHHNTGDATAYNSTVRLSPMNTTQAGTHVFYGTLTGGGVSAPAGSTTIYTTDTTRLTYIPGSVKMWGNGPGYVAFPIALPYGQTGDEIFTGGLRIGDIPGMNTCPNDSPYNFCNQGTVTLQFKAEPITPTYTTCAINNFYPSQTTVPSGSTFVLNWQTTNCTDVRVDGVAFSVDGSDTFGPIYGTTNYTLTASNPGNTATPRTIAVYTSQVQQPQCNDGIDNDLNGYTDFAGGDQGCYSAVDTSESGWYPQQNQCSITNFTANPTTVAVGGYSTLSWNTSNCDYVEVSGTRDNANGTRTFGPLNNSQTYQLKAWKNNQSPVYSSVTVSVNSVQTYACSDNLDNDGDGRIDLNDVGCTSSTDNDEYNYTQPVNTQNVFTGVPTNISQTSARLNGTLTQYSGYNTQVYFEWGLNQNVVNTTNAQTLNSSNSFFDTLTNLSADTLYYYRAVANSNGNIVRGDFQIFKTTSLPTIITNPGNQVIITRPVTTTVIERGIGIGSNLVSMRSDNRTGSACVLDNAEYTFFYKNISERAITDAVIQIALPADFGFSGSSAGIYNNVDNTLTINVGNLQPQQEQSVSVRGIVKESARDRDLLVATATMSFTNPYTSATESAVAYGLINTNNCQRETSSLAGLALFGNGFLPGTLLGWLIFILLILAVVMIAREVFKRERIYMMHHKDDNNRSQFR